MGNDVQRCPVCAESIDADAKVCRFCDSDLQPPAPLPAYEENTAANPPAVSYPVQWEAVLRDLAMTAVSLFVGALLAGVLAVASGRATNVLTINVSVSAFAYLMLIAAFTISGCLVRVKRIRHVCIVALLLTLLNVLYGILFTQYPERGFSSLIPTLVAALIGSGLSFLFVSDKQEKP